MDIPVVPAGVDDGVDDAPLTWRERRRLALAQPAAVSCPYLSTVSRRALDFDMEKVCSVTLSPHHVYACLVCGKFFAGRGRATPAYAHSVEAGHHVWVGLTPPEGAVEGSWLPRFWSLPEGHEVLDASLEDIAAALRPRFAPAALATLQRSSALATDASGTPFLPGYLGVNNLGHTDGMLSVVQALAHVQPLLTYFLADPPPYASVRDPLVHRFADLLRRLWAPRALRATVSPQEFVNAVSDASSRRFSPGAPVDASEFLAWLLNTLHRGLVDAHAPLVAGGGVGLAPSPSAPPVAGSKRPRDSGPVLNGGVHGGKSIISLVFAGEVEVTTLSSELAEETAREAAAAAAAAAAKEAAEKAVGNEWDAARPTSAAKAAVAAAPAIAAVATPSFPRVTVAPFLFLSLDLPPAPLFKDATGGLAIPQVPVYALLQQRFDGVTVTDTLRGQYRERRRFRLLSLPSHLLLVFKRFSRDAATRSFCTEKNPTIVTFPPCNLELRPYISPPAHARALTLSRAAREEFQRRLEGGGAATSSTATTSAPWPPDPASIDSLPASALKHILARAGVPLRASEASGMDRGDLVRRARAAVANLAPVPQSHVYAAPLTPPTALFAACTKFDLVASVVHEVVSNTASGEAGAGGNSSSGAGAVAAAAASQARQQQQQQQLLSSAAGGGAVAPANRAAAAARLAAAAYDPLLRGSYRAHVLGPGGSGGGGSWFELLDLRVSEVMPQQVSMAEACLLVYARKESTEAVDAAIAGAGAGAGAGAAQG